MKLIIFYPIICTDNIGCAAIKFRIPPLSFMKGRTDVERIIDTRLDFNIPSQFYELFAPVDCYSYSKCNQYTAQNWISGSECIYSSNNAKTSKKMPPHKLQRFLGVTPYGLYRIHSLSPLKYDQITTPFTKNTPQFNNINERGYPHTFQKRQPLQGGNTDVLI